MRRSTLFACALAVGGTAALAGCGAGSVSRPGQAGPHKPGDPKTSVVLTLVGSSRPEAACGSHKPFALGRVGLPLPVRGQVKPDPASSWRVKLKLKRCDGSTWRLVGEQHVDVEKGGHFQGTLLLRRPGAYTVRAYFYYPDGRRVRSDKAYTTIES